MEKVIQIIVHIPWWVYVIFAYIVIIGFRATRTRIVSLHSLWISPIFFTIMSLHTLYISIALNYTNLIVWVTSSFTGFKIGYWYVNRISLQIDKKRLLIRIPGTWSTLSIFLSIFMIKFYVEYKLAIEPLIINIIFFNIGILTISGFLTGLLIGKLFGYFERYKNSEDIDYFDTKLKNDIK